MDQRNEQTTGVVHLSENEFHQQVGIARDVLNGVYAISQPLLMLGYNGAQIRALQSIYSAVEQGDAVDAKWNDEEYPFYQHRTSFENENGRFGISFSGNGDFFSSGYMNELLRQRKHFPIGSHPTIFLLRKAFGQDVELKQIGQRIFWGKYVSEAGIVKKLLAKTTVTKVLPSVRDSYEVQWLDDDTKTDAVFYFPARDEYEVFRKVKTNGGYEVWGRRQNINSQQIKQAISEKRAGPVFTFQLSPAPVKA